MSILVHHAIHFSKVDPRNHMLPKYIRFIVIAIILAIVLAGFMLPEQLVIPVLKASKKDWNHETFWYEPWGKSGVHKGIDIFAAYGSPVISASSGVVIFQGQLSRGGNVVAVLGPKWRIHYYSHLSIISAHTGQFVSPGEILGEVGNSGNAKTTPPHLHYSIITVLPYPWRRDNSTQGWKKMFFLNPSHMLLEKVTAVKTASCAGVNDSSRHDRNSL